MKKRLFTEIPRIEGERVVLRPVTDADAEALRDLVQDDVVYRYLPTYLFERQFDDVHDAISQLYGDLYRNKESLILGVSRVGDDELCGFCELYGLREEADKISLGYRFRRRFWGQGIATETVALAVRWLYTPRPPSNSSPQARWWRTSPRHASSRRTASSARHARWKRTGATTNPPSPTSGSRDGKGACNRGVLPFEQKGYSLG